MTAHLTVEVGVDTLSKDSTRSRRQDLKTLDKCSHIDSNRLRPAEINQADEPALEDQPPTSSGMAPSMHTRVAPGPLFQ